MRRATVIMSGSLSPMLMNFPTPAKEHSHDPDRPVCRNRRRLCRALAHRHTRHCTDARSRPIVRYRECARLPRNDGRGRSEENTSELQSLMRISYAVFGLKKKKKKHNNDRQIDREKE